MTTKVTFAKDYDHEWPSRAMTAYKAGETYSVKREVEEAARAAGVLSDEPPAPDKPASTDKPLPGAGKSS